MALQSVPTEGNQSPLDSVTTIAASFHRIPVADNRPLLQVNPNMPAAQALSLAACLAESISGMAMDRVDSGADITSKEAYLIAFTAQAIQALCNSARV